VIILDDHLALLAITGRLPDLGLPGPVVTTYTFHFRLLRAVSYRERSGSLARRIDDPAAALRRVQQPPANRLVVLDPRVSLAEAVEAASTYRANLLLAELVGAAGHHQASVRVAAGNAGRSWASVFGEAGLDFATVSA
jgi:hypothetical protein